MQCYCRCLPQNWQRKGSRVDNLLVRTLIEINVARGFNVIAPRSTTYAAEQSTISSFLLRRETPQGRAMAIKLSETGLRSRQAANFAGERASAGLPTDLATPKLQVWDLVADGIEGNDCPQCKIPLVLARIRPSRLGFDLRTFRCDTCNHSEKRKITTNSRRLRTDKPWPSGNAPAQM